MEWQIQEYFDFFQSIQYQENKDMLHVVKSQPHSCGPL